MRNEQNIYDNAEFFKGYQEIRDNPYNYNLLIEHPALISLLPDLNGKTVLDMGCGFGEMCEEFLERGAAFVTGIDVSENMLCQAKKRQKKNLEVLRLDMCDIKKLDRKYDVITSSLAVHYIADWGGLAGCVYDCLNENGVFVFSQEHPLTTAPLCGPDYEENKDGEGIHYHLSDYGRGGKRTIHWLTDGVEKYHRTFSEILNTLTETGFRIEKLAEPLPAEEVIEKNPRMRKEFHKPSFFLVKAVKNNGKEQ